MTRQRNPPADKSPVDGQVPGLRIRSKGARFRRAGIEFTREGVVLDAADLTEEQIDAIKNEPNLVVEMSDLPKRQASEEG